MLIDVDNLDIHLARRTLKGPIILITHCNWGSLTFEQVLSYRSVSLVLLSLLLLSAVIVFLHLKIFLMCKLEAIRVLWLVFVIVTLGAVKIEWTFHPLPIRHRGGKQCQEQ